MLNGLDLFSGIGGLSLALANWVRPLAYCERDNYCQALLLSLMADGKIPRAPIWPDITSLTEYEVGWPWVDIDIIYGGFPCQDISVAGNGIGLGGKRSGLYWHMHRLIGEMQPSFVFLENVPAIRTRGLIEVVRSLTDVGYDCRWTSVSAAEVGAPHLRKRWFLLASNTTTLQRASIEWDEPDGNNDGVDAMAYATGVGSVEGIRGRKQSQRTSEDVKSKDWWAVEPRVDRVAHGISHRVDRLRGLGNAVVPFQAQTAFERLMGFSN